MVGSWYVMKQLLSKMSFVVKKMKMFHSLFAAFPVADVHHPLNDSPFVLFTHIIMKKPPLPRAVIPYYYWGRDRGGPSVETFHLITSTPIMLGIHACTHATRQSFLARSSEVLEMLHSICITC